MKFHLFVVLEEVLHETSTAVGEKKKKKGAFVLLTCFI